MQETDNMILKTNLLVASLCAMPALALAELGQAPSPSSTLGVSATDKVTRRAFAQTPLVGAPYTVQETTIDSGVVVREYVDANGIVFAVAWQGPRRPDLNKLLGDYFGVAASSPAAPGQGAGQRTVQRSDFVLQTGGHMGSLAGCAYLPQRVPVGVAPASLN
jgi:hypothetical protein